MRKFFSSFLALAFLLPAIVSADYCVSFPTGGESKWSKRDNSINVRFRYESTGYSFLAFNNPKEPGVLMATGAPKGSRKENRAKAGYTSYRYGATDLCINNLTPDFHPPVPSALRGLVFDHVRLDVKWGGDCGRVAIKNNRITGDHKFEIYRRKGNHIDPFGCRRKK